MRVPSEVLWTVYGIGVVLFPVVVGIITGKKKLDVVDDGIPLFFLSLLWPIAAFFVVTCWCVMVVCCIPGWIWTGLVCFGSEVGCRYGMWKEVRTAKKKAKEKRERKEREDWNYHWEEDHE